LHRAEQPGVPHDRQISRRGPVSTVHVLRHHLRSSTYRDTCQSAWPDEDGELVRPRDGFELDFLQRQRVDGGAREVTLEDRVDPGESRVEDDPTVRGEPRPSEEGDGSE